MISKRQLEERELRKERILDGALRVFQRSGLEGATMDEIAQEAGFGKATLYYYFPSKEEVFCAIMEKGWKPLWEGIETVIHRETAPKVTFFDVLKRIVEITLKDRILYRFLFTAPKAIIHMPENEQTWKRYQNRMYRALSGLLEEGIARGDFPKVDADLFMRAIGGLFHGLMFLGEITEEPDEEEIEKLISRLLNIPGVTTKGGNS
ncbi:MAG: TetR/AcrR family transcriptional regulator [Fidelibacterota bacterium]